MQSTPDVSSLPDESWSSAEHLEGYSEVFTPQLITTLDHTADHVLTRGEYWFVGLTVWLVMCSSGIFGNILVIFAFLRSPKIRTATNYLVCNLAVIDLITGMLGVIYAFYSFTRLGSGLAQSSRYACIIPIAGQAGMAFTSVAGIFAISLERLLAVQAPLRHRVLVTVGRVIQVIACMWLVTGIVVVTPIAGLNVWQPGKKCAPGFVYPGYLLAGMFALPMVLVIVCIANALIAGVALRRFTTFTDGQCPHEVISAVQLKQQVKQYKITRMLLTVVGSFLICWLPLSITAMHKALSPGPDTILSEVCRALRLAVVFIDPIIYASQNERFYTAFRAILTCDRQTRLS